jgi:hypothetical protein
MQSCTGLDSEINDATNEVEATIIIDKAETRRLFLIEQSKTIELSLDEQYELDSLEIEKYKDELKEAVLNMSEGA